MQLAEQEARERKRMMKEQEERLEKEFRNKMLEKFANDDKLEQLAQNKRRMKEVEHKKEVERLWQERLKAFRIEQEKQEEDRKKMVQDESWK